MEKKMSKIGDYLPYIAMAAIGCAGIGLAGAGAGAGATIAPAAGAGALGAAGTQTGLALGSTTGAALAPETAFLAGLGGTSPAVAPLATQASYPFMGGKASILSKPEALQIGTGYEGVTSYADPINIGTQGGISPNYIPQLDTSYADILSKPTNVGGYPFMGGHDVAQWAEMTGMHGVTNYAVEEGTKTLMDQLGLGYGDALALAANYYSSSMQPPNFQGTPSPTPTGRQYQYQPSTMAQIMDRTRGNYNRQIRRSTV